MVQLNGVASNQIRVGCLLIVWRYSNHDTVSLFHSWLHYKLKNLVLYSRNSSSSNNRIISRKKAAPVIMSMSSLFSLRFFLFDYTSHYCYILHIAKRNHVYNIKFTGINLDCLQRTLCYNLYQCLVSNHLGQCFGFTGDFGNFRSLIN